MVPRIITLENGLRIKGSFKYTQVGYYLDLYVTCKDGKVVADKTLAVKTTKRNAQEVLHKCQVLLYQAFYKHRLEELSSLTVLKQAIPFVMSRVFTKDAIEQAAA